MWAARHPIDAAGAATSAWRRRRLLHPRRSPAARRSLCRWRAISMNGWVQDHLDVPCRSCDYVLVVTLPTVTCDRTGDLAGLGTDDASPKPVDLGFAGPNELRTCAGDPTQPVPEQEAPPAHPVGAREPGGDDAEPGQPAPEEDRGRAAAREECLAARDQPPPAGRPAAGTLEQQAQTAAADQIAGVVAEDCRCRRDRDHPATRCLSRAGRGAYEQARRAVPARPDRGKRRPCRRSSQPSLHAGRHQFWRPSRHPGGRDAAARAWLDGFESWAESTEAAWHGAVAR